jgi:hypothetical protein
MSEYYRKHRKEILAKLKQKYASNSDLYKAKSASYYAKIKKDPVKIGKRRAINRKSKAKQLATKQGCLNNRMRAAMWKALKGNKIGRKWEKLVGYSVKELATHLEKLFVGNMSWNQFSRGKIHIDHIRPLSTFQYDDVSDNAFKECWALSNLQPLWALDNIKKRDKLCHP